MTDLALSPFLKVVSHSPTELGKGAHACGRANSGSGRSGEPGNGGKKPHDRASSEDTLRVHYGFTMFTVRRHSKRIANTYRNFSAVVKEEGSADAVAACVRRRVAQRPASPFGFKRLELVPEISAPDRSWAPRPGGKELSGLGSTCAL